VKHNERNSSNDKRTICGASRIGASSAAMVQAQRNKKNINRHRQEEPQWTSKR